MWLKNSCEILYIIILMSIIFVESGLAKKPPFIDPKITSGEKSTYKVIENGKTFLTSYTIFRQQSNDKDVYLISAPSYQMILEASDLRPFSIKKTDNNGDVEFSIEYLREYGEDRVWFRYPGPKRNVKRKVPEDRYDIHTVLQFVRGFPFGQREAKFTLITPEHPEGIGAYIKIVGSERVTTPAGDFDCYQLEAGIRGWKGKIFKTKFFFWVEKEPPHRLIKNTDSDGERAVTLVDYEFGCQ